MAGDGTDPEAAAPQPEPLPEPGPEPQSEGECRAPGTPLGTFASLRIRDFRLLWLGQISNAGAVWMEIIARPVLVYEITGSAAQVGGVVAMRTLPQLLFGVWAGVVSDWFDRKRVLLAAQLAALLINVAFAALIVSGRLELWHIYLTVFLRGTTMAFDQPARQSLVPSIVGADRVTNALALLTATQNTMRILGTALAGFLLAFIGLNGAFIAIAAVYAGAALWTAQLRVESHRRPDATGLGAMGRGLVEGARYASGQPEIRGVLVLAMIYFTFGMSYMQVFAPLFALEVLEIGRFGFGVMMSLTGVGALAGALFIACQSPRRLGLILPSISIAFGVLLVIFSLLTYLPSELGRGWLLVPLAITPVLGLSQTGFFSLSQALMLDSAPDHLRGRILSLLSLDRAMVMLGASAGGVMAELIGTQLAQIIYGVVVIIGASAVLVLMPGFRNAVTTGSRGRVRRVEASPAAAKPAEATDAEASPAAAKPAEATDAEAPQPVPPLRGGERR